MHADQGVSDIDPGFGPDMLHRHRIGHLLIGRGGKGTARLGLGHHIDCLIAVFLCRFPFQDQRPVQMLTALSSQINSLVLEHLIKSLKHDSSQIRIGERSDPVSGDLTAGAADHHQVTEFQIGLLQKFLCDHFRLGTV